MKSVCGSQIPPAGLSTVAFCPSVTFTRREGKLPIEGPAFSIRRSVVSYSSGLVVRHLASEAISWAFNSRAGDLVGSGNSSSAVFGLGGATGSK